MMWLRRTNNKKKVIFLDFDGTLAPIVDDPEKANISVKTKGLIKKISSSPDNTLVIVSGRPHEFLQQKFKDINCYLAFEHGALFYDYKIKKG